MRMSGRTSPRHLAALFALLVAGAPLLGGCDDDEDPPQDGWALVFEGLDEALLSVWGTAADDVWVVGADAGSGPAVLRYDGEGWTRFATGATGALWWVHGLGDTLWMVGEGGLILRHTRGTTTFEEMAGPPEATLFGVMAFAEDDVWAVGGDLSGNRGVVWHFDGARWQADDTVPEAGLAAGQLFKVWGRSADDLWVVGLGGIALHRSADGWRTVDVPTGRGLFTVHGDGDALVAVGGFQTGLVVHGASGGLTDATPAGAPQLNGVFVRPGGDAVAVGLGGAVWRRVDGEWAADPDAPRSRLDHHAVYVDPTGGVWAVGGFVISDPLDRGMLAHFGGAVSSAVAAAP